MLLALTLAAIHQATTLTVGDGKTFARIEAAVAVARAGDTIAVYPSSRGYPKTAIRITVPRLTIRGMAAPKGMQLTGVVALDGDGFNYSGVGRVPRAIIQIEPGADGARIELLELRGAHNDSHNGAGIRVNQAKNVTVDQCDIHGNDMGIMSNGREGDAHAGESQVYSHCVIRENGSLADPGYNHNLYLGGTSATVEFCSIYGSLTGHNLKSRAHFNLVRYCWISGSANRECDFVDAWDTARPNSNAVLIGNVIEKDAKCTGNRMTIHFGVEKGEREGNLYLINNTIFTPFASGVVGLSTATGSVVMTNNVIVNSLQAAPSLIDLSNGASRRNVSGSNNWISRGYDLNGFGLTKTLTGKNRSDYPVGGPFPININSPRGVPAKFKDGEGHLLDGTPRFQYRGDGVRGWIPASAPCIGAG